MAQLSSTPQKILGLLKKHQSLSVQELTTHLQISDMAVRKHLNKLAKDQFIQSTEVKQPMGRPVTRYQLSKQGESLFPRNYGSMTVEFLQDLEQMHGAETVKQLFKKREDRLQQKYQQRIAQKEGLQDKIMELQKIQAENGYMAEYQQIDENQFELIEYNCPIYQVADQFKQACHCELSLFKNVLGVKQIDRTSCISEGAHCCRYIIKAKTD
jgi:iron-sulfur cluster biosynthesis transcriptional regulator SufR